MALLESAPGRRMQITNLNKALFYLDLTELLVTGKTLTGATYIALQAGPVVAKYQDRLVKPLETDGLARQASAGDSLPIEVVRSMETFQFVVGEALSRARAVARRFSSMTAAMASDLSHENPGWKIAYAEGLGSSGPAKPIDMLIALQQLGDDDHWLDTPPSREVCEAFATAASGGEGEPW